MDILSEIRKRAKALQKRIALPESQDGRVLKAAEIAQKEGIASVVLLGEGTLPKKRKS